MTIPTFDFVRDNMAGTPFHQWLVPELVAVSDEKSSVTIRLAIRPDLGNHPERTDIHGGVVAALIDLAGHAAVAAKVRHAVPTINLSVDYLRPASGTEIIAVATVVKLGRSVSLVDISLTDDKKKIVAVGRASYMSGISVS